MEEVEKSLLSTALSLEGDERDDCVFDGSANVTEPRNEVDVIDDD